MLRRPISPRVRAVEKRAIAIRARAALAAAEVHHQRASAGIFRLEGLIAEREGLGLSIEAEMAHIARLRIALTAAEADLIAARRTLTRDHAA